MASDNSLTDKLKVWLVAAGIFALGILGWLLRHKSKKLEAAQYALRVKETEKKIEETRKKITETNKKIEAGLTTYNRKKQVLEEDMETLEQKRKDFLNAKDFLMGVVSSSTNATDDS